MGSSGSGKFGTYRAGNGQKLFGDGSGNGGSGGSGEIECPDVIESIRLEDVATSDYYVNHQTLPSHGEPIELNSSIYNGRLVVKTSSSGEVLGNLPTKYNYLISCIKIDIKYSGTVIASGLKPVAFVVVTLHA